MSGERRRSSVYEDRGRDAAPTEVVFNWRTGELVGYQLRDGTFREAGPCCDRPLDYRHEECWRPWPGRG
jgi:hypothetical protein